MTGAAVAEDVGLVLPRIGDQLWDRYGHGIKAAELAAIEAQAAVAEAMGSWA